uniref:Uncharacterized protein n=1 Tax=Oryza sativa subsp. japonica TaxID=39947 RepID=Q6Z6P5_ORYSJ|nr:hypothetical protein [Oryza sativa Japonica Group]BAD31000.1 hypothetical protein [Oryza sativa Japonica Group]
MVSINSNPSAWEGAIHKVALGDAAAVAAPSARSGRRGGGAGGHPTGGGGGLPRPCPSLHGSGERGGGRFHSRWRVPHGWRRRASLHQIRRDGSMWGRQLGVGGLSRRRLPGGGSCGAPRQWWRPRHPHVATAAGVEKDTSGAGEVAAGGLSSLVFFFSSS